MTDGLLHRSRLPVWTRLVPIAAVAMLMTLAACPGSRGASPTGVGKNDAIVLIQCEVADAELWVDDRFVAEVGRLRRGIALSPGDHRIEVRHDRYHTHYEEIQVAARERRTVAVELAESLP